MTADLPILLLEDNETDAQIVSDILSEEGIPVRLKRVETRRDFEEALDQGDFELILADYLLPAYDGLTALAKVRQSHPEIPFILISGVLGEEAAIESLKCGATDYVLKQRLSRLAPAVRRALQAAEERRQREQVEKTLRRQEEQLRFLAENMADIIWTLDLNLRITYVSPSIEKVLGFSPAERAHQSIQEVLTPESLQQLEILLTKELRCAPEADPNRSVLIDLECYKKDGSTLWLENSIKCIRDDRGDIAGIIGNSRDISIRKRMETEQKSLTEQFIQAQKLEAVARLTGGVAHDFNNLLTTIIGNVDLVLLDLDLDSENVENLRQIREAGMRAAKLTRQLLAFSRKQVLEPEVLDLNTVIGEIEEMLRRLIGEDIELQTSLTADLGLVKADAGQMEQVLMNLVVNARDAMPRGGLLTIETANVFLDETYALSHMDIQPGLYVMIGVSDTGSGMKPEVLARVFEPFFTTKEQGKGTGLGLSTVYGIVKQSGGSIWVYSEPGMGTTFKIYLPRVEDPEVSRKPEIHHREVPRGNETILVVEDEERLRILISKILTGYGYDVLLAADGSTALEILRGPAGPAELLLTDVVLPGMSGRDVAETIRQEQPDIQILYMSGYTDETIVQHGIPQQGEAFIQKPFSASGLGRKVREILDKRS